MKQAQQTHQGALDTKSALRGASIGMILPTLLVLETARLPDQFLWRLTLAAACVGATVGLWMRAGWTARALWTLWGLCCWQVAWFAGTRTLDSDLYVATPDGTRAIYFLLYATLCLWLWRRDPCDLQPPSKPALWPIALSAAGAFGHALANAMLRSVA